MLEIIAEFENLDATLGLQILHHKPLPCERPDARLILPGLKAMFHVPVSGIAILREGEGVTDVKRRKFGMVLQDAGFKTVWAETAARRYRIPIGRDVVDDVTDHFLKNSRAGIVIAGTHEQYAASALREQRTKGARVGILGFTEFISDRSAEAADFVLDLEFDLGLFNRPLPRIQPF